MGSPFMARAIAGHLPLKNSHLLSAVIVGLMVTGVQAADPEFKKECTMGLAMKKIHPHGVLGDVEVRERQDVLLRKRGGQVALAG
jgi:hypothetical protein